MINAEKSDVFDVLAYIAFALAPMTRSDRVEAHRGGIVAKYNGPSKPSWNSFWHNTSTRGSRSWTKRNSPTSWN